MKAKSKTGKPSKSLKDDVEVLDIDSDDISIKATTTEKLGFTGRQEGVSAYALVLIVKS